MGAAFRAVRIRRGWTQAKLANRAGVSASLVSLVERGHLDSVSVRVLRRIAAAIDIRLELWARMRTGDLDRIINAGHAALHEELARHIDGLPGWIHAPEVSFAVFGERGVIDVLAFHAATGSLLRHRAQDRAGLAGGPVDDDGRADAAGDWHRCPARLARPGRQLLGRDGRHAAEPTARRAPRGHAPLRVPGHQMRAWLRRPLGSIRALSFWPISNRSGVNQVAALRRRVRQGKTPRIAA